MENQMDETFMENQMDIDVARRTSPASPAEKLSHKFALSVTEAAFLANVGRSQIYVAVAAGELRSKKRGLSTLILPDDLRAWLDALPDFAARSAAARGGTAPLEIHNRRRLVAAEAAETPAPEKRLGRPRRAQVAAE